MSSHVAGAYGVVQSAYSPDGLVLVSAALNQSIRLWDAINWTMPQDLAGILKTVFCVVFHPHGEGCTWRQSLAVVDSRPEIV